jgi:hypothetical protein
LEDEEEEMPVYHVNIIIEEDDDSGKRVELPAGRDSSNGDIWPRGKDNIKQVGNQHDCPLRRGREKKRGQRSGGVKRERTREKEDVHWEKLKHDAEIKDLLTSESSKNEHE